MYYKLSNEQENQLLNAPETGMGYQVIEAGKGSNYTKERFVVLNSVAVIEINGTEGNYIGMIINEGINEFKTKAKLIVLNSITVLNEIQFRYNKVSEPEMDNRKGAMDNRIVNADGIEMFVRLSAFEDDKRIDKLNKCLRKGSFATTFNDFTYCKRTKDDPIERYALPNNDNIKFVFHIQPKQVDTLQKGIVQPANNKHGSGEEVYFENGTSLGTYKGQKPY